jgi:hypothetical protein
LHAAIARCLQNHEESPLYLHCGLLGGGEGWLHALLAIVGMYDDDNCNGNCLSKKGLDRGKGEGELKDGFDFSCCFFCYCFLACLFQCRLVDFLSRSKQLLDKLLLQDFSSSCPNLVITFLLSNYGVRVNCGK